MNRALLSTWCARPYRRSGRISTLARGSAFAAWERVSAESLTIVCVIRLDRTILGCVAAATRQGREFCTICGWPLRGSRCDACGENQTPLALEDSMRRFVPQEYASLDDAGLEKAMDAFRRGDFARAVGVCLATETRFFLRTMQLSEGPAWTLTAREATVLVSVELVPMQLVIESPVGRLPRTQRVAAMRFALELCDDERLSSRICLRDDLLVMRFVAQLGAAPPVLVRHVVHEMMAMSERYAQLFVAAFKGRSPARSDGRSGSFDTLGKKRLLGTMRAGVPRTSIAPPPPPTLRPDFLAPREDDIPPILAPMFPGDTPRRGPMDELPPILTPPSILRDGRRGSSSPSADDIPAILAPPPMTRGRTASADDIPAILAPPPVPRFDGGKTSSFDDIPAILAPPSMLDSQSSDGWDAMPPVLMPSEAVPTIARAASPASTMATGGPPDREAPPNTARLGAIPAVMMTTHGAPARQRTAMGMSDVVPRPMLDPETEVSGRKGAPAADKPATPADKLCELLHRAQALATALSFAERQATTLLLVRAVVYRATYEYAETLPDAVAYLHRTTTPVLRQIWSGTAPAEKNAPMPMAEPSFLAMERIVAQRGQMPKESKLTPQSFTTAAQAREHLTKYVEEIELSPNDPPLRHFLAAGALSELLVRARLPSQTAQRIKDIVAHAQREVNKPASSLELMMAALKRIIAG